MSTRRSVRAGWVALDVLCHPVICVLIDAATGAWMAFDPLYVLDPPAAARSAPWAARGPRDARDAPWDAREGQNAPEVSGEVRLAPIRVTRVE